MIKDATDTEVIDQVVRDIIDMKIESNNVDDGDTLEDMLDHYVYALLSGHIEIVYRYGKLMAFADWVRVPKVPEDREFTSEDIDTEHGGPVLYIMNCCVRDDKKHKYLWRIVHMLRMKNNDVHTICWHDRDEQGKWRLKLFTNVKKEDRE